MLGNRKINKADYFLNFPEMKNIINLSNYSIDTYTLEKCDSLYAIKSRIDSIRGKDVVIKNIINLEDSIIKKLLLTNVKTDSLYLTKSNIDEFFIGGTRIINSEKDVILRANINNIDARESSIEKCVMEYLDVKNLNLSNSKMHALGIGGCKIHNFDFLASEIGGIERRIEESNFSKNVKNFLKRRLEKSHLSIYFSDIDNINMNSSTLTTVTIENLNSEDFSMSNSSIKYLTIFNLKSKQNISIMNSQISGDLMIVESKIKNLYLKKSKILGDLLIERSKISSELNLDKVIVNKLSLKDSTISKISFPENIKELDLRGTHIKKISFIENLPPSIDKVLVDNKTSVPADFEKNLKVISY